ncbi:MAG: cytochrome oxidase Cu insertion factor (SCO1/SenC/PrrC family) [Verrucomicrobiales bacterium]|jgi:cytochrome oxidase Cu insertion factor (SCO1/SenC/PrrC family)
MELMKTTLITLLLTAALGSAQETNPAAKSAPQEAPAEMTGLEVGKQAPPFTLKNQDGKELEFAGLLKKGPVAVVFYRSADW